MFSVELLQLRKPSMVSWNRDTLTLLGAVVLVGVLAYEAFRRFKKQDDDLKQQKKRGKKRK